MDPAGKYTLILSHYCLLIMLHVICYYVIMLFQTALSPEMSIIPIISIISLILSTNHQDH